ncbi:hypothetical protein GBAR_LOCUS23631 [Geodia barretti]|nr:hypothetical protein GBAR_LOCUS23631 [Geodia barretti]
MDWLFGTVPVEVDRTSVFGVGAGQPLMSVAKRDGVSGAGFHQSTRSQRPTANGRDGPRVTRVARRGEEERGREREERRRGNNEEKGGRGSNEERGKASRASLERRREGGTGLSGQMNRNREALEQRKQALTELEQKTEQLAGDADDFASLAAKLANKSKARVW